MLKTETDTLDVDAASSVLDKQASAIKSKNKNLYSRYIKRLLDIVISFMSILLLSPVFIILSIIGSIKMKGNPFFTQIRPGYHERLFKLVKFRTMTNETDRYGKPLPDDKRLTRYGKFLRKTSLDELPELWNILKGDMSIIGPRPLLTTYLPYYKQTHDVRPGLTGLAQVNGRNSLDWNHRFQTDVEYVSNVSFCLDVKIFALTIVKVLKRGEVADDTRATEGNFAEIRKHENEKACAAQNNGGEQKQI